MIPNRELVIPTVYAPFIYRMRKVDELLVDYEFGGVAIGNITEGFQVQEWVIEAQGSSIYLKSPNTARYLLYTHSNPIVEIAFAFNRNMYPVVTVLDSTGNATLYQFSASPTPYSISLGAIRCPRMCIDDHRPAHLSYRQADATLIYIQGTNLVLRYETAASFNSTYTLASGVIALAKIVCCGMNELFRFQIQMDKEGSTSYVDWKLSDVVSGICKFAGITDDRNDVSQLENDTVPGIMINVDEGMDKPIDWLREIYFFDKAEFDGKIHWVKRGGQVVARIPYKHLMEGTPTALKQVLVDEKKLPRIVNINHLDPAAGHAKNKQTAERRSNLINTTVSKSIESKVVLSVDQAATAAMTRLKVYYNELVAYTFTTTIRYTNLTVTDLIEVEDESGVWHRMRIEERNEDSNEIEWTCTQDAGEITYSRQRTGNALPPPVSTTPGVVGDTVLEIVDVSPLYDQDDELGLYIAAAGAPGSTWSGYQLMVSVDGGNSYVEALSTSVPSTIGDSLTDLINENASGHDFVSAEEFEVTTNFPLASVSSAQIAAGANRFCLGGEVGQFETATLIGMAGTLYHYNLSGLRRAKYGTKALLWPSGSRFVVLDETVAFVQAQRAMIGVDIEYKPVSFGRTLDETVPTDYLFDEPASQIEWTPDAVGATRDIVTNDVTVTFTPRPRLGQFGTPFNSKYFRGHRIKFSDAHTIDTYNGTAVYPNAPLGVTVQVCGLNEITGEGPYSASVTPV